MTSINNKKNSHLKKIQKLKKIDVMNGEMLETIGTALMAMLVVGALYVLIMDGVKRREKDEDEDKKKQYRV